MTDKLTRKMILAAEYMALHPILSDAQVAKDLNISTVSIMHYRQNPVFMEYYEKKAGEVWHDYALECQDLMMQLARNGNFQAVKYILDYAGFGAPQQIELNTNTIKVTIDD